MIRVTDLKKTFGRNLVFSNLSFEIQSGEKVAFSAPSGGGKTTLLRILCGLDRADQGSVEGLNPEEISYCFQEPRLFPHLTALENVTCIFPRPEEKKSLALELLQALGLEDAAEKLPHELSGGMKQRVALARTLAADRPVVFLDEPFAALDEDRKESVRKIVATRCADKTLILVSHDPADREVLTDREILL